MGACHLTMLSTFIPRNEGPESWEKVVPRVHKALKMCDGFFF